LEKSIGNEKKIPEIIQESRYKNLNFEDEIFLKERRT
jgi:hypothetical protein